MRYIDFHTHIVPKMDDGAQTMEESLRMLLTAKASGADAVVLSPHFLNQESIYDFCRLRDQKIADLKKEMAKTGDQYPALLAGAEVYLGCTLSEVDDIENLCIEGTNTILLELPYPFWNKWHIQEVYHLIARRNLTPVMAHIERYLKSPKDIEKLDRLISVGAKFQVNASSFLTFSGRRVIKALAQQGLIAAIGSDCHDERYRTADLTRPLCKMEKQFGDGFFQYVFNESHTLIN